MKMTLLTVLNGLQEEMKDLTPDQRAAVEMVFTFSFGFYQDLLERNNVKAKA